MSATTGSTPPLTTSSGHVDVTNDHLESPVNSVTHTNRSNATISNSDISDSQITKTSKSDRNNKNISTISTGNVSFINTLHHCAPTSHTHSGVHCESHLGSSAIPSLSPQRINLNSGGLSTTMAAIYPSMHQPASMTMSDTYRLVL